MTPPKSWFSNTPSRAWLLVLTVAAALGSLGVAAGGQQGGEGGRAAASVAKGRVTYRIYCTSCHGAKAQGDGKLAGFLSPAPADLTRLARSTGDGEFPAEQVHRIIDGREKVPGHGGGEMPAWGDVFQGLEEGGSPTEAEAGVQARIADLVAYLESIQE